MIGELLTIAFSVALGGVFAWKLGARFTRPERSLLWWAWGAHILAAFAKVVIVYDYYGFGDMRTYLMESETIAAFIRADPERWLGPYLRFGLHQDVQVPYVPMGSGGPTQTMFVFAGLFQLVAGSSKYGVSVFVAAFSFASKVALYSVFRAHFPQRFHGRIAVATLLIPSAVFWSASLSKEGVLWMSCGWVLYGFHRAAFERRWVSGAVIAVLAAALSSLVKA